MSKHIPDDRRFMTHEERAATDARYRGTYTVGGTKAVETCYCGKTVVATHGRSTGVTCPRDCERERV
jgi:hypothetical protein